MKKRVKYIQIISLLIILLSLLFAIIAYTFPESISIITGKVVSATCSDSDGGLNIYLKGLTKGVISGKSKSLYDSCTSSTKLKEYYCTTTQQSTNNMAYQEISCSGCSSGVCISPINGVCGILINTCSNGTFKDRADNLTNHLWNCSGIGGGTSTLCSLRIIIDSASGYLGMSLPADFVAFSSDSPWNTPIPTNATIDPNSTLMITKLASNVSNLRAAYKNWTSPVHVINYYETRKVNVTSTHSDGLNTEIDPNGDNIVENIPIPSQVWQDAQTDGHVVIIDPNLRISWEFSRFKVINAQQGIYNASMIHRWDLNSKGYISPFNGSVWWAQGVLGSGEPILPGLVRIEEIKAGAINHAIRFSIPINRKNTTLGRWELVSPACRTDGGYTGIEYIPEGARLQLNPNLNLDSLGLTEETKIIARALQTYGIIDADNTGTDRNGTGLGYFNIYFQNIGPNGWNNYTFNLNKINTSEFRVLKMNITAKA